MAYLAGYLFKISHSEIHYLRNEKIDRRKKYTNNFTTNENEAHTFNSIDQFKQHIQDFLDYVNAEPSQYDDYHYVLAYKEIK